jgi:hypothetical protein
MSRRTLVLLALGCLHASLGFDTMIVVARSTGDLAAGGATPQGRQ